MIIAGAALLMGAVQSYAEADTFSLQHRWIWESSMGGFTGRDTLTPGKAGYTRKIRFLKNGTFRGFRNDTLLNTTRFAVRKEQTIFSGDSLRVIRFADSGRCPKQVIWKVTRDTLELGDNHVEPFMHRYRRSGK